MRYALAVLLFCAGIFCLAQSNAQVPITGAGLGAPASGFTPSCSQSSTFLTAATGVTLTADKTNYDTLICGLQTDGNFAGLDGLYIWAAPTTTNAANINLVNPGTFNGTPTNGSPTFTAYHGYTGDAAAFYIDTGFNPSTATSPNFVQNSATIGVYNLSSRTTGQNWWAQGNIAGSSNNLFILYQISQGLGSINSNGNVNLNNSNAQGAYTLNRVASNQELAYTNDGETPSTFSDTSQTVINSKFIFFAFNAGFGWTGDQMAAGWWGKGFTAQQNCQINRRINTYMTAYSVNVYTNGGSAC